MVCTEPKYCSRCLLPQITGDTHVLTLVPSYPEPTRMSLKLLTHGNIDSATGLFLTPTGKPKYYVSSDNVSAPTMKNHLYPSDLCRLMDARSDLHWDSVKQVGVILPMLSRVSKTGILSMTAIGDSIEDAHRMFNETQNYLTNMASVIGIRR